MVCLRYVTVNIEHKGDNKNDDDDDDNNNNIMLGRVIPSITQLEVF